MLVFTSTPHGERGPNSFRKDHGGKEGQEPASRIFCVHGGDRGFLFISNTASCSILATTFICRIFIAALHLPHVSVGRDQSSGPSLHSKQKAWFELRYR